MVMHKKDMDTVLNTLLHANKLNVVTKQGVQSNSSEDNICSNSFGALSIREEHQPSLGSYSFILHIWNWKTR